MGMSGGRNSQGLKLTRYGIVKLNPEDSNVGRIMELLKQLSFDGSLRSSLSNYVVIVTLKWR